MPSYPSPIAALAVTVTLTLSAAAPAQTKILKQEPPMGALKEGQRVLVDDGKCPMGQIREVTGGNHVKVGGRDRIERTWRCISRP